MSLYGGLQAEIPAWGGSMWGNTGSNGVGGGSSSSSSRPRGLENLVAEVEGQAVPTQGASGALNGTGSLASIYGGISSVFSPLFSPLQPQQSGQQLQQLQQLETFPSGFSWQSLLGGQQSFLQAQVSMQGCAFGSEQGLMPASSLDPNNYVEESQLGSRAGDGVGTSERSLRNDSSEGEGSSERELVDRLAEGQEVGNLTKKKRHKYEACSKRDVKRERSRDFEEGSLTHRDGYEIVKQKPKQKKPRSSAAAEGGQLEDIINFELSASSSESESSCYDSDDDKKEIIEKKRKRVGQDADGNVTWTDESVRFLFEAYDAVHRRLWEESKGHVKYQKKWTPILKSMEERFGKHFTKKQCQSKYWSVRRECTDYRYMSTKAAQSDPSWNPNIAGRELLKPKFYDVWFEVSGRKQAVVMKSKPPKAFAVKQEGFSAQILKHLGIDEPLRIEGKDELLMKPRVNKCGNAVKEMKQLMQVQLQASEKREEVLKYSAELMMELLTQHMENVENRVSNLEGRDPQGYLLERVNYKLEKVLEGFSTLNENLSTIVQKIVQKQTS